MMKRNRSSGKKWTRRLAGVIFAAAATLAPAVRGASFGTVVPIGGHASDIALDEPRGVVYVANFAANRIDIVSLANHKRCGRRPARFSGRRNGIRVPATKRLCSPDQDQPMGADGHFRGRY